MFGAGPKILGDSPLGGTRFERSVPLHRRCQRQQGPQNVMNVSHEGMCKRPRAWRRSYVKAVRRLTANRASLPCNAEPNGPRLFTERDEITAKGWRNGQARL